MNWIFEFIDYNFIREFYKFKIFKLNYIINC